MNTDFSLLKYLAIVLSLCVVSPLLAENAEVETTFYLPIVEEIKDGISYRIPKVSESHFNSIFYNMDGTRKKYVAETVKPKQSEDSTKKNVVYDEDKLIDEFKTAIKDNDYEKIKDLFNKGLNKNYVDEYWKRGLISIAIENNNLKAIKFLVKSGVPLCPKGAENPIFLALNLPAKSGILQYLIDIGCDVNAKTNKGVAYDEKDCTPILYAAYEDASFDVLDILLKNGADITHVSSDGNSVLDYVIMGENDASLLEYFIQHGINIDSNQEQKLNNALFSAAYGIEPECFKVLLEYGADPFYKVDGKNAIIASIRSDSENLEIMQMMFDAGVSPDDKDKNGKTALYYASQPGHFFTSLKLIQNNANVDIELADGSSPLIESCKRNGLFKSEDFWQASRNEFNEILKRTKNVDFKDKDGRTALMWVMISEKEEKWFCNHIMMVKELIKAGADPYLKDNYGKSAIDYANELDKVSAQIYKKQLKMNN